jgi:Matrixin
MVVVAVALSCQSSDQGNQPDLYFCNAKIGCGNPENVPYCTWGFKFGDNNPYSPNGAAIPGPGGNSTTSITYRFLGDGQVIKTSHQNRAETFSFTDDEKRIAMSVLSEWQSVAKIAFDEIDSNERANITIAKVFLPFSNIGGIAAPAYLDSPCNQLSGLVVVSNKFSSSFRSLLIHEIGHALGLGHVGSYNVMRSSGGVEHLQSGDIQGIQSIYGIK